MSETHRAPEMGATPAGEQPRTGTPRWVKVALIVVAALAVLFVVASLTGLGGDHGPGRHGGGGDTPPSVVDDDAGGHRPRADHGP